MQTPLTHWARGATSATSATRLAPSKPSQPPKRAKPPPRAGQNPRPSPSRKPKPKPRTEDDDQDDETDSHGTPRDTGDTDEGDDQDEDDSEGEDNDDEGDEEGEDGDDKPHGRTYELKVNGEVRQLTFEQLKEAASKGFSATERWEKASTRHKEADQAISQVNQQRAQLGNMLNVLHAQTRAMIQGETPANLDELAITDPAGYVRAKHALERRQGALRDIEAAHAYLVSQQRQQDEQRHNMALDAEKEKVLELLPEWRDGEKAKQSVAKINTFLAERGFTNDEIAGIGDSRIVRVLNQAVIDAAKAAKYDELRNKSKAANKRVQNLPPVIESPGARQSNSSAKAERRRRDVKAWEQAPNLDNLARLF